MSEPVSSSSRKDTYPWNPALFSQSANNALSMAGKPVSATELIGFLLKIHPEYARTKGAETQAPINPQKLLEETYDSSIPRYTNTEWAEIIKSIINPGYKGVINGRRVYIAALLFGFKNDFISHSGYTDDWKQYCIDTISLLKKELNEGELTKDGELYIDKFLTPEGEELEQFLYNYKGKSQTRNAQLVDTQNLSDRPTDDDALSRRALAKYIANRLRDVYKQDIEKGYGSFFMHIDGAWGSGKSTLLRFLELELQDKKVPDADKWIVVNFNAWEHQRLDPPWWFLMKTVYNQSRKQLKSWGSKNARKLFFAEHTWRLNTGTNHIYAAVLTFILFIVTLVYDIKSESAWEKLPLVSIATFIGFLWSLTKFLRTSLVPGSAKAAQTFLEQNGSDPLKTLSDHFKGQVERAGYPIAIFIDDLDRCNKDYGIKLLEGLQTIYRNAPVVYIVAADRKWLSTMYENQYQMFAPVIARPAKPFGMVFLDKTFQLIVELPNISAVQKKIYWDKLLNVVPEENENPEKQRKNVQAQLKQARNNEELMAIVQTSTGSRASQQIVREEVIGKISIREEEKNLTHKLQDYVALIEPNPRAMKRLVNDIGTAHAIAVLYGESVNEDQLILWTIFKLHYPLLADYFWENPEKLDESMTQPEKDITGVKEWDILLRDHDIKKMFRCKVKDSVVRLDTAFLRQLQLRYE